MGTVYRILKYEGNENWLNKQLDSSIPNGIKQLGDATITAATVDPNDTDTIEFCRDQLRRMNVSVKTGSGR